MITQSALCLNFHPVRGGYEVLNLDGLSLTDVPDVVVVTYCVAFFDVETVEYFSV